MSALTSLSVFVVSHVPSVLFPFLAHLYKSTGRAIAVTTASVSATALASSLFKMLKCLVEVFKSLYLLNPWMDLVDTLPDVRYWSEDLCCTIMTHISDLEVKVTGFEILKFLVEVFRSLYLLKLQLDLVDTFPDVRYWSEVLCCTIITHISDLEVKVIDFEILS